MHEGIQRLDASGNSHVSACISPNTAVDAFLQDRKSLPRHMNAGLHSIIFDESLRNIEFYLLIHFLFFTFPILSITPVST